MLGFLPCGCLSTTFNLILLSFGTTIRSIWFISNFLVSTHSETKSAYFLRWISLANFIHSQQERTEKRRRKSCPTALTGSKWCWASAGDGPHTHTSEIQVTSREFSLNYLKHKCSWRQLESCWKLFHQKLSSSRLRVLNLRPYF